MSKVEPRILKGFRDYLPSKMIPRQKMIAAIEQTFQRFGFLPLMTPALEYLEVLTGKYGQEGDQLLYRFQDHGGRDVGLRYDLTVPLARVVAQYPQEVLLPFRRYQIAPVWRAENPARGRFREFVQCDADVVGSADMAADAELVQLGCELLEGLGVQSFRVRINNRKVLSGILFSIGQPSREEEVGILRTIDKLPKVGKDEALRLLETENGLSPDRAARLLELVASNGPPREILRGLDAAFKDDPVGKKGVAELLEVVEILEGAGIADRVELDLSIARGLAYYTGTIYETFLLDLPGYGSVMSGGRYDELVGVFRGQPVPAVGISLGIDRLLEGLVELGVLKTQGAVAPVLVTLFAKETAAYSARVARLLRAAGIGCELYPAAAKIGKQLARASENGQRWVVVAGPDEAARGEVAVKDLETRTQETMRLDALAAHLGARMAGS
ncbi:MAG TPA: histidine--tRNA ligase [Planctomycetota bacterium]|jgi:histidyl-tRNA synthetase|nr:histidine--tRNA ligase [Planctomycetota bacterium]